jgi:hypothetical protein
MITDRWLSQLERLRLIEISWWTLARVLAWMVATLVLIGLAVPDRDVDLARDKYNRQSATDDVRVVGTERGDQRGFAPTPDADMFKIAWIAGSSIQGVDPSNPTFVPVELQKRLAMVDGRPVSIDIYFLSGMRIIDQYAAVLAALEAEPDMIVVTLNPVWVLNDRAVQGWDNLDGILAADLLSSPRDWRLLASIVSPSDLLGGTVGRRFDAYDDRYHWGQRLHDRLGDFSLLDSAPLPPEADPTELEEIAAMQIPIYFWDEYAPTVGDDVTGVARRAAAFQRGGDAPSGVNQAALRGMFRQLADTEIPVYLYLAQIDEAVLDDPRVSAAVQLIEQRIESIAAETEATNVVLQPRSVSRTLTGLPFKDIVHLYDVTELTNYLATELCDVLRVQGHEPSCELSP